MPHFIRIHALISYIYEAQIDVLYMRG